MISIIRNIKIWVIFLLGIFMFSCSDVDSGLLTVDKNGNPILSFDMTRSPQSIVDNTQIYVFNNPSWEFYKRMLGVTSNNNILSMSAEAGTWNMALVTAETSIASSIISPVNGQARTGKLWETQSVGGELPSMPELRTAYLTGQQVIANQQNYGNETAMLYRNVALVKVVIDKTRGLDPNGTHKFELHNVPTTLNWAGELYPDKDNPAVSIDPMKGTFTIKDKLGEPGVQDSDTLKFIIPAHKGTDFLGAHNDTTTNNLTLSVDLACLGGVKFEKANVEIPRVPRVNGILLVKLSMIGQLEVSSEILDWVDVDLNADLTQTQLFVDKAEVGLAYKDTVYVNTNASTFTFAKDPAANWITALNKIGNNGVEIVANVDTYVDNSPRSSYITITANNVTKKIPVTQRPDRGTISVNNKRLVFCPTSHEQRSVEVNSIGGDWEFIDANIYKATPNKTGGSVGVATPVTFTRGVTANTDNFNRYYGDTIAVVRNKKTLDTDTISLINCFIYMDDNTINASAPTGTNQTAVTVSDDIVVYGGSRELRITDFSSWIHSGVSWNSTTQKLTFTTDREDEDEARTGYMKFYHAECPDYIINADVYQDIIVTIPEFDFFVVKFTWDGNDVDIAAEFAGNSITTAGEDNSTYDKIPVGYSMQNYAPGKGSQGGTNGRAYFTYNGGRLLNWGGDATSGQGETVFFNAPLLEGDVNSPRKIKLEIYATWWNPKSRKGDPMAFNMVAYKGGSMSQSGTNFNNSGGVRVNPEDLDYTVVIDTHQGNGSFRTGGYEHVATLTYDRVKHSASVKVYAAIATRSSTPIVKSAKEFSQSVIIGYDDTGKPIYR